MAKQAAAFKTVPAEIPANAPYKIPRVTQEEAWAIKGLLAGTAEPAEQGIAVRYILGVLADIQSLGYYPDARDHAFAGGKRFVGHCIIRIGQMDPGQIALLEKYGAGSQAGEDDEMPRF